MVKSKMENAHGFMLSISAAIPTKGKSHAPSLLIFHNTAVPTLPYLKKIAKARRSKPAKINNVFLFMKLPYGVTYAENPSSTGAPALFSRTTTLSILPTPAGPCAFGSKTASTETPSPGSITTLILGTATCPGIPNGPNFLSSFNRYSLTPRIFYCERMFDVAFFHRYRAEIILRLDIDEKRQRQTYVHSKK